jgi:DNA-binding protein
LEVFEMSLIEIGEKDASEYVSQAKEVLNKDGKCTLKGKSRDTVTVVDVAELLKKEGFKIKHVKIDTEEHEVENKKQRISVMIIEMEK